MIKLENIVMYDQRIKWMNLKEELRSKDQEEILLISPFYQVLERFMDNKKEIFGYQGIFFDESVRTELIKLQKNRIE